jgi:signal transduction histidine kinase
VRSSGALLAAAVGSLLGLTALVLALGAWQMDLAANDIAALGLFLLTSGGFTLLVGWLGAHVRPIPQLRTIRTKLIAVIALVAALAMVNVAFTAQLMFFSAHDFALLALLLLFSFGVSVWLAFFVSLRFDATIRGFVAAVDQMGAGKLGTRVTVTSRDELEQLARAFNMMAAELETAFAHQREMEHARRELIAAVSHDLRNPLASMRAMVESINDGVVADEATIRRYLGQLQREVEYLSRLIDDLFELSQIDAGLLGLQLGWASLQDVISDTLEAASAQAAQRGLTVQGSVDEEIPPLSMDTRQVQRVLANLVQNALRHTPPGGTIRIAAHDAATEVEISVADTGEGIPQDELPRIFEQFFRGDRARSRDHSGSGLGLTIARGVVAAHGGRIWAESTAGEGSTFVFTLPKGAPITPSVTSVLSTPQS